MKIIGQNNKLSKTISKSLLQEIPDSVFVVDPVSNPKHTVPLERCIAVVNDIAPKEVVALALQGYQHIVQIKSPCFERELLLAAKLIVNPKSFLKNPIKLVLEKSDLSKKFQAEFFSSATKDKVLDKLQEYLVNLNVSEVICSFANTIADELFTNAIFNGPFRSMPMKRNIKVELPKDAVATLHACIDEERLFIYCQDPFGSLDLSRITLELKNTFELGISEAMNKGDGGAGIGCRMMFDSSTSFYALVQPGKNTIVGCSLPLTIKRSTLKKAPRNLNFAKFD